MKATTRILAFALALCLVYPFLPGGLFAPLEMKVAAEVAGNGVPGDPYLITSFGDFKTHVINASHTAGVHYRQTQDFTFSESITVASTWAFAGNYDGEGFTISLSGGNGMRSAGQRYCGVFSAVSGSGAVVKNLNVNLSGFASTVGSSYTQQSTGSYQYKADHSIGGIAGLLSQQARIDNCGVSGTMNVHANMNSAWNSGQAAPSTYANGTLIGGIAGEISQSTISGCYVSVVTNYTSDPQTSYSNTYMGLTKVSWYHYVAEVGGVAGRSQYGSVIENCMIENTTINAANKSTDNVGSTTFVGGILGRALDMDGLGVRFNTFRGTRLYANYGLANGAGYAAGLIGRASRQLNGDSTNNYLDVALANMAYSKVNGVTNNFANCFYSGAGASTYSLNDMAPQQTNTVGVKTMFDLNDHPPTAARLGAAWVEDVVNASGQYLTQGPILKWRTTAAPTVESSSITAGQTGGTIHLRAPARIVPTSNLSNPTSLWDGAGIRYELTYHAVTGVSSPGRLPTRGITAKVENDKLKLSGNANTKLWYSTTSGGTYSEHTVPIDLDKIEITPGDPNASPPVEPTYEYEPVTYYVKAESTLTTGEYAESYVVTIAIDANGDISYSGHEDDGAEPTTQSTPVTVKYGDNQSGYHFSTASGSLMTITLEKPVAPDTLITISAYMITAQSSDPKNRLLYPRRATDTVAVGAITRPPSISPSQGGTLENGISISGEGTIRWTVKKIGGTTMPDEISRNSSTIPPSDLGGDWNTLEVTATAEGSGKSVSAKTVVTYPYTAKVPDQKPYITIGGADINPQKFYSPGDKVRIWHDLPGDIYYVTGDQPPGRNTGTLYNTEYELRSGMNSVTISAVLVRDNYPDTMIATETIYIKTTHSSPIFSIENTSLIPDGQTLSMLIAEEDLPPILRPAYYMKAGSDQQYSYTDINNNPGEYYGVIEVYDYMVRGEPFVNYSDYSGDVPYITYTVGAGGLERTYTATTPEIRYYTQNGQGGYTLEKTVEHVMSTIPLTGTPGTTINVNAKLTARNNEAYLDGSYLVVPMQYTIYSQVAAPKASPATSSANVATVNEGSTIALSSETPSVPGRDVSIFYSLTGTPSISYNSATGAYTPNAGTFLYNPADGITVSGKAGTYFIVYAGAVRSDMSPSEIAIFTYQLPAAVQAVLATPNAGEVTMGTPVSLTTTTEGAMIFYEIAHNNDTPKDPVPYESQVFEAGKPIIIEKDTNIRAIAVKNNVSSITTEYEYTLAKEVRAPTPSLPSGSVVAKGTKVTLTSSTSGTSIIYTKDGSDPTDEKNTKRMYGSDIVIDAEEGASVSISAYATKSGLTPSSVVSLSYSISRKEDVLAATPATDSVVKPGDVITLSTSVTGATIHYTTDGSEPTASSKRGSTIIVSDEYGENFTVRAIAVVGDISTTPAIFTYKIIGRTPAPSASIPNGAVILEGAEVVLTAPEGDIYYTTDGSEPTTSSQLYTGKFKLTGSTVLKAVAKADDKAISEVAEYIYTMAGQVAAPTASLPSGTIEIGSKITLSTGTEGAAIYYTTNGVTPTADNLKDAIAYDTPITVSRPVSIKMFAVKDGMRPSVVNSATYTVADPPPEEEADEVEKTLALQGDSDKLFLFDQFVGSAEGPLFEDIVLHDPATMAVVSAQQNALPEGVQLVVTRERSPSSEDSEAVRRATELQLGSLYNITLLMNGEIVQPQLEDAVEVGMPIPDGYEDTVVLICRINDNGTVTALPTRRSGDMVYAVTDHFSKYAVAVPPQSLKTAAGLEQWHIMLGAGGILAVGGLTVFLIRKRKKAKVS